MNKTAKRENKLKMLLGNGLYAFVYINGFLALFFSLFVGTIALLISKAEITVIRAYGMPFLLLLLPMICISPSIVCKIIVEIKRRKYGFDGEDIFVKTLIANIIVVFICAVLMSGNRSSYDKYPEDYDTFDYWLDRVP